MRTPFSLGEQARYDRDKDKDEDKAKEQPKAQRYPLVAIRPAMILTEAGCSVGDAWVPV